MMRDADLSKDKSGLESPPEFQRSCNDDDSGNNNDDGNDTHDSERTDSDDNENPSFTLKDNKEEEHDEEYVHSPKNYESDDDKENVDEKEYDNLYKDVDVKLLGEEHEKEGKDDAEMADADQNVSQDQSYEQVVEDAHVTPISSQKTKVVDEFVSMMNVKVHQEESSAQAPQFFNVLVTAIPETSTAPITTVPPAVTMITHLPQMMTPSPAPTTVLTSTLFSFESLIEFKLKKILLDKMQRSKSYKAAPEHKELYKGLVTSYNLDKDLFSSYGKAYSLKRDHEDKDKDKDPPAGSDQGLKKRKTSKDAEPSKGLKLKESKSFSSSKGTKPQTKSSGKSTQAEEPVFEAVDTKIPPQTWISKIAKARQPPCTFDELISTPIDFSAYVKNHLKIENLTQEILVGPALNLLKGTYKSFVALQFYFEECYKTVNDRLDWHNPEGHEYPFDLNKPFLLIEYQRRQVVPADYFINNDLEYLKDYMYDLGVALRMFTIRISILYRVEDLQLRVESYQKKLNITRPETFRSDITNMTPFTAYKNPQGIIYLDKYKKIRLICSDELYKFCDETLSFVRTMLNDITNNLRMDYLPKRK
nr:hypothetical protein [Tanacetum cinerariifolium]